MTFDLIVTLLVLAAALAAMLSDRVRPDVVALLVVVALGGSGVLTSEETFSGFSRSAVITIIAIFIVAEGLQRAGIADQLGGLLARVGGGGEGRMVVVVMAAGALLSLVMNNIAAAAVLLPAATMAGRRTGVSPARLLMPLAFGTLLGGMATLLTTTNIVVGSLLRSQGLEGFGLLDFAPVGLPLVAAGIVYMAVAGRRRLPADSPSERMRAAPAEQLVDVYRLEERLFRARVPSGSSLIDRPLAESTLRELYHLHLVAVERGGRTILSPPPTMTIEHGDVLHLEGDLEDFKRRDVEPYLEVLPPRAWRDADLESADTVVIEAVLAPRSALVGKCSREARFRTRYGMSILAVWRGGEPLLSGLSDLKLAFGDALLLQGSRERLEMLRDDADLILLPGEGSAGSQAPVKRWTALGIVVATLALAVMSPLFIAEIMLGGALALVLTRVLSMDQAYRAVEWKTVFLVAGMLPLGVALSKTGAAALLARGLVTGVGGAGPLAMLAGLFVATTLLVQAMNGPAVAAIMAPIAITVGQEMGVDPRSLAMGVALATSMAFLTPLGHPVNLLVMGSGGYRFRDYWRVGLPLTLVLFAIVMLLLPRLWPL
jgi:di/tricarboxylate transporter